SSRGGRSSRSSSKRRDTTGCAKRPRSHERCRQRHRALPGGLPGVRAQRGRRRAGVAQRDSRKRDRPVRRARLPDDETGRVALHTAFPVDGGCGHAPADATLEQPLEILYLATGRERTVSHPRTLVVVERGARAAIVETFAGVAEGAPYWTNAVSEEVVGQGA